MIEQKELIEKLRAVWEDVNLLYGMFNIFERYKNSLIEAREIAGKVLFDLTGEEFYIKNNKPNGGN